MKVLHIDEQDGWRGGEQQASWLMQGLAHAGHTVYVAGRPNGKFLGDAHKGVKLHRIALPLRNEFDFFSAWKLSRIVRKEAIDIIHAHTSHAHSLAVWTRLFAGRGKVVVSRRVSFAPKKNMLNRWKYQQPDKIIAVSHHVGRVLLDYGLSPEQVTVVHSSVDPKRLETAPLARQAIGVPEEGPLLLNAGALVGHKDHANLLAAMPAIVQAFPALHLMIAGEGELRAAIEAQIMDLGLQSHVTLLGHRTDVPALIRTADLYVSSSWSEGLGTSILESLTCQTPVVATQAGGADEMVIPEKTGYLVPCRDADALAQAVIASLENREKALQMAQEGRALIGREFVTERMVEGTLREYAALLA